MISQLRRLAAIGAVVLFVSLGAAPAYARPAVDELRLADGLSSNVGVAPAPCNDTAYKLLGGTWRDGSYSWAFDAVTTPSSLDRSAVLAIIKKSFGNITGEHNDCGRARTIGVSATYLGTTTTRPNCNQPDGYNVIGFGKLAYGVLAVTCYWISGGRIVEADMKINSQESWALSISNCHSQVMMESTVTHEAGHVFGLDHVGERRHGRLTMSPYIDGLCENQEATLGLGDMRGLEALY
jgi:hypothetical protein